MLDFEIIGDDMQIVEFYLAPGQAVIADSGAMLWMDEGIKMHTRAGGIFKGMKRLFAGENFFMPIFKNETDVMASCAFGEPYPGKIIPVELSDFDGEVICQREAFLCGEEGIEISIAFTKRLGAGFFGGEGFVLEKIKGDGVAFFHAGGEVVEKELSDGQVIRVDTGCLVAFSSSVDYSIEMVKGVRNVLFGGEGLFLAKLTGPGTVFLQSLPISRLADRILKAGDKKKQS